jgi:hypothetical protein
MPASLVETDGPVIHSFGEREVIIPRNTTRLYLPWLAELEEQWRKAGEASIPPNAPLAEQFKFKRAVMLNKPTPSDLKPEVWTAAGALRVLDMALEKAGVSDKAERERLIDSKPHYTIQLLALRVSGLYTEEEIFRMLNPTPPGAEAEKKGAQAGNVPSQPSPPNG